MAQDFQFIIPFSEIKKDQIALVGGKGVNLGILCQAGYNVPDGFCLSTSAFTLFIQQLDNAAEFYSHLNSLEEFNLNDLSSIGSRVRSKLDAMMIPAQVTEEIIAFFSKTDEDESYAIRSSATLEDLAGNSFAGQQDTFLNIKGIDEILFAIKQCWISLFTDRAISYRTRNGFCHKDVELSVVVQKMVIPDSSGIMFTADPITSNHNIISIDAGWGVGEGLVSGLVSADLYLVDSKQNSIQQKDIKIQDKIVKAKQEGGVEVRPLSGDEGKRQVLSDSQILALAQEGKAIEQLFGSPQDIEWCCQNGTLFILQSRPITTLFPVGKLKKEGETDVFICFNHMQVMTNPLPPAAINIWQFLMPFGKGRDLSVPNPFLHEVGGRIYIDVSRVLRSPAKHMICKLLGIADKLIAGTLKQIIKREGFRWKVNFSPVRAALRWVRPILMNTFANIFWRNPEKVLTKTITRVETEIQQIVSQIENIPNDQDCIKYAQRQMGQLLTNILLRIPPLLAAGMFSHKLLKSLMQKDIEKEHFDNLLKGLEGNVTTNLDLEVGDLADVARTSPEVKKWFLNSNWFNLKELKEVPGSFKFLTAFDNFIKKYGMRGAAEIDISQPRWEEDPLPILQVISANLNKQGQGEHRLHHQTLMKEASASEDNIIRVAGQSFWSWVKVPLVRRLLLVIRTLTHVREHPKFYLIQIMSAFRKRLKQIGIALYNQGRLVRPNDIWFLEHAEILEALSNSEANYTSRIGERKTRWSTYEKLSPPRVITSEGETPLIEISLKNLPKRAMAGSIASSGVVEGRARVILDPRTEQLMPGEILVAPFTDPGWTPLFINAAGLVMEVGGLMTHGSVVAREYGIPAVVCVLDATKKIKTGQRIRINGEEGYVEIISE